MRPLNILYGKGLDDFIKSVLYFIVLRQEGVCISRSNWIDFLIIIQGRTGSLITDF